MKKSDLTKRFSASIEQCRFRKNVKSYDIALYLVEITEKAGLLPPFSEEKAKRPKPTGHEWDDE